MTTLETPIYLIPTKILLLNVLKRSILNGGPESSANNLPIYLHSYLFQSSLTLFLESPEYLVDVSPILLILLATAVGSSSLSCGSESIDHFFIGDYHLSFCSETQLFYVADINK